MEISITLLCVIYCIFSHYLICVFTLPSLIIPNQGAGFRGQIEEKTSDPCYSSQIALLSETEIADTGTFF